MKKLYIICLTFLSINISNAQSVDNKQKTQEDKITLEKKQQNKEVENPEKRLIIKTKTNSQAESEIKTTNEKQIHETVKLSSDKEKNENIERKQQKMLQLEKKQR